MPENIKQQAMMRPSYVNADNLYDWVGDNFKSFDDWRIYENGNNETLALWEAERMFRIVEGAKSGLITEVLKGNASAVSQLKSLLGFSNPVGRPRGSGNVDEETKQAFESKILDDFSADVARMTVIAEGNS